MNASMDEKCGNVLSAPQCVQWALQIVSVLDKSSILLPLPRGDGPNQVAAFVAKDIRFAFA